MLLITIIKLLIDSYQDLQMSVYQITQIPKNNKPVIICGARVGKGEIEGVRDDCAKFIGNLVSGHLAGRPSSEK